MSEGRKAFGQDLNRLRTERGVGLEELAAATKVRVVLLRALEEGRFDALPPAVFVEGYLKAYARYFGADPAQFVKRYRILAGVPSESAPTAPVQVSKTPRRRPGTRRAFKWMGAIALIGGLGYASFVLVQQMESTSPGESPSALRRQRPPGLPGAVSDGPRTQEPQAPAPPSPGAEGSAPGARSDAVAGALGAPPESGEPLPPPAPSPLSSSAPLSPSAEPQGDLILSAKDVCWCEIWADGKRVLYRQVSAGERLGFSGDKFKVSLGSAGAVEIHFRGASVALPPEKGRVVTGMELPPSEEVPRP
jgi:cytoskeleton protein RodZ